MEQLSAPSTSFGVKLKVKGVSSAVTLGEIVAIEGSSLTAATATSNESCAVREPSLAVNVIVELPLWFRAGLMFIKQFGAVPVNETPETGITAVLLDAMLIAEEQFKFVLSMSLILTEIPVSGVSSSVD